MKLKLSVLFIGALILASGCAKKCPPCPSCALGSSYGQTSSYAPAATGTASYSAPVDSSASNYSAAPTARYVSK